MFEPWIRDILLASQNGDTGAFEKLVETYQGYAFSLASRFLGNEEDAQDVVQEAFIRVWKHLSAFDYRCKFTTWMYRIVTNLCLDRVKFLKRKGKILSSNPTDYAENLWENVMEDIDLEDKSIKEELAAIITGLAAELTPRQRAVFVLRDLQDVSIAEAAQILGISKSSVKSNLCHARQNIRKKRFAWFFTYFSYREIYRDFFPFRQVPLEEYFSPEELKIVKLSLADEDKAKEIYPEDILKKIEEKFDTWTARAIFEEFFLILLEKAKKLNRPDLKPGLMVSQKEALFTLCRDIDWFEKGWTMEMLKKCEVVLQTPGIVKIREQDKKAFSQFEGKMQALDSLIGDEFTNEVIMPGLITDTNAETVKGRKVTWKFNMDNFFLTDYEMWVTSRRVNWWVVGIAAFLLILVLAALIAGTVIRRKRRVYNKKT